MFEPETIVTAVAETIAAAANPDGGWGYHAGKSSRLEPTCWATLAVADRITTASAASFAALVLRWQQRNGLLTEPGIPPNLAGNGLASLVISRLSRVHPAPALATVSARHVEGIRQIKGIRSPNGGPMRQNNELQGWPWTADAFSWVEPTAWCLLALKRRRRDTGERGFDARIIEAEELLLDRACRGGGWNYGNSNVLGQDLRPYIPTTSLALLALQDRPEHAEVRQGLEFLEANWRREPSGMALALAAICLSIHERPAGAIMSALAEDWQRTGFLGDIAVMGMASCALAGAQPYGHSPFSL